MRARPSHIDVPSTSIRSACQPGRSKLETPKCEGRSKFRFTFSGENAYKTRQSRSGLRKTTEDRQGVPA